MLDVYFSGTGLDLTNHVQTALRALESRSTLRSVHGISSGAIAALLTILASSQPDPSVWLMTWLTRLSQRVTDSYNLYIGMQSVLDSLLDLPSDIHIQCKNRLIIYYFRYNPYKCEQIQISTWASKKHLISSIRRSCAIPCIVQPWLMDTVYYYHDGIGFMGYLEPDPSVTILVSDCSIWSTIMSTLYYCRLNVSLTSELVHQPLLPNTICYPNGTVRTSGIRHQYDHHLRLMLWLYSWLVVKPYRYRFVIGCLVLARCLFIVYTMVFGCQ